MSLAEVYGYDEEELRSNRAGRLAESQAERLDELIGEARRLLPVRAVVAGCTAGCLAVVPSIALVIVGRTSPGVVALAGAGLAVVVSALSIRKQRREIAEASAALSARTVEITDGPIEIERCLAIPAMKRGYHLRLTRSTDSGDRRQWAVTTAQGAELVEHAVYRIYWTASVIQSIERVSEVEDVDADQLLERPPIRWTS